MKKITLAALIGICGAQAQDAAPLDIFGFYQVQKDYRDDRGLITSGPASNSAGQVQQLNLFLSKDFGNNISGLVNTEWYNDFDLSKAIGGTRIKEAWVGWEPNPLFKVKFGKLVPEYTEFSQIKDKMPLHPFIIRPLVYEASTSNPYLDKSAWVANSAWGQISGVASFGSTKLKYAVFTGNSDNIDNTGRDSTTNALYGARLGAEFLDGSLRVAAFGTFDNAHLSELEYVASKDRASIEGGIALGLSKSKEGLAQANAGLADIKTNQDKVKAGLAQLEAAKSANLVDQHYYDSTKTYLTASNKMLDSLNAVATVGKATAEQMIALFSSEEDKAKAAFNAGAPMHVKRYRFGGEFTYEAPTGTTLSAEYIQVAYDLSSSQEAKLKALDHSINFVQDLADDGNPVNKSFTYVYDDLDRNFYSVVLSQRIGEQWNAYAATSRFTNNWHYQLNAGLVGHTLGLSYQPVDAVTLKAQYSRWGIQEEKSNIFKVAEFDHLNQYAFAASVMF